MSKIIVTTKRSRLAKTQGKASGRNVAIRFLIEDPTSGWRVLPTALALAAYRGEASIPDLACGVIRVASVKVGLENGKPTTVIRIDMSHWLVGADGQIDQGDVMTQINRKLDAGASADCLEAETVNDRDLVEIARCLSIPISEVDTQTSSRV